MFNGIGLQTPRGSGTSGHVQKNTAVKKTEGIREKRKREAADEHRRLIKAKMVEARRNAGVEVRRHDQKRKIEVKCMELRENLEDQELDDLEIDRRVAAFRSKLITEHKSEDEKKESEEGKVLVDDSEKDFAHGLENDKTNVKSNEKETLPQKNESQKESTLEPLYNYVPRYEKR